jgi:phosphoribosylglycinamide formyltransferase-1
MNIAVFCSGNGSNLQAIINAVKAKRIKAEIKLVLCDKGDAFCLKRARRAGLKAVFIDPDLFRNRQAFDEEIVKHLKENKIELIVLAGYMRILSNYIVKKYRHRILNVHPALLPAFKGANGIKDAYKYGVKVTGVTIHFVNEKLDSGPIILQDIVKISKTDTLKSLELKIHKLEHSLYPKAIDLFARGKLKIQGKVVKIRQK